MEEQGAFVQIVPVVEVCTFHQVETLQRTLLPDSFLYDVRCVRAAFATASS